MEECRNKEKTKPQWKFPLQRGGGRLIVRWQLDLSLFYICSLPQDTQEGLSAPMCTYTFENI